MKRALITGITRQDGSYLAELFNTQRMDALYQGPHEPHPPRAT